MSHAYDLQRRLYDSLRTSNFEAEAVARKPIAHSSPFIIGHNTLAAMHGYAPIPTMDHEAACRVAFMAVRRDVWSERESRLRATWESYG